jgi:nitrate/nitrite transport system permease protein
VTSATVAPALPSPAKTWEASKPYVTAPFEKRGELDQGILRFTWYSLVLVAKGSPQPAAIFTIAICAMWPTVLNTALGVRSIPQDYLNVAKVLGLSRAKTLFKVMIPAAMPYIFTGFRLSLGIAWLVIVAVEMLTASSSAS